MSIRSITNNIRLNLVASPDGCESVSLAGGTATEKAKLSFALHMMRTFGDEDGVFLDLMES